MRTTAGSTSAPESNGRAELVFSPKRMDEGRRDGKHAGARNGIVRTL